MTLGSLFDGIGGFPLAGVMCGITPVWSSEIEPFPLKVTAARFPDMKQLGSVTEINGAEIEPVDIITFGSPCQDLSVAGKQKGIHDGERSNLFFEAIRIIKEMRDADRANGRTDVDIRPRFAVWENVPGAFSSNKGEDFRAVLEAFASVCQDGLYIPRPKKWNHAGAMVGDGWSLAWRVYDAQYWGVPQRRKRIYLIADFGSERAHEILFESESVCGDSAQGREAGEGTADDAERSAGGGCGAGGLNALDVTNGHAIALDCRNIVGNEELSATLAEKPNGGQSLNYQNPVVYSIAFQLSGDRANPSVSSSDTAYCLSANPMSDRGQSVVCVQNTGQGWWNESEIAQTLRAPCGWDSTKANLVIYDARGNGDGKSAPTLTGDHQNRVTDYTALAVGNGQLHQMELGDKTGALNCMHDQQAVVYPGAEITNNTCRSNPKPGDPGLTLTGNSNNVLLVRKWRKYIVRCLTPTECARLQGFPDWWCEGLGGSDSAIYKAYGNGLALPCAYDVLKRIAKEHDQTSMLQHDDKH